ncbi:MAG: LacI family DNA-binding transcriptional regulator [Thermogemmatispora sp.]|uniref:LacI family DNA-binding transcriptional regulator n=1 Tax=Thermogemmatispora sp. TaxID=1968838 RepID=UPI00262241EE|nr:LacI family DNA-binding transcriptional regulator [Thermogemmatispora sp.]MBX5456499.1 LacI family DNA-binding transcriptional regulator [Thermogemmatispora sp.]
MKPKVTIEDIARLAGVSKATVSRVLNERSNVKAETRERVLRVMQEQGFVPSLAAAGLAGGRSRLVGVLTPPFTQPTVPEILRGVAEAIEHTDYEIVLYSTNAGQSPTTIVNRILALGLTSCLLVIQPGPLTPRLLQLASQGLPVVVIDDQGPPPELPSVGIDNRVSAYQATMHLIRLGYRRIAHLQGPAEFRCAQERYQGYRQALEEAGLPFDPALVFNGTFETASGRACAAALVTLPLAERPEAIFIANDQMAFGFLSAAEALGLRIPQDLAVVGFDDIPLSAHVRPTLTTIKQPFYEMGRNAVELLLSLLHGQAMQPVAGTEGGYQSPIRIQLPTRLVIRESCGALTLHRRQEQEHSLSDE